MAFHFGNNIVTEGIVLYLDAANRSSYPGSGTAWRDLTANKNDGTLINSPMFSSANGGSIVFNGNNNYVTWPNDPLSTLSLTSITYDCWFRLNSSVANTWLFGCDTFELYLEAFNTWYIDGTIVGSKNFTWTFNTNWNHLAITYTAGTTLAYINTTSVIVNSGGGVNAQGALWIGSRINLDTFLSGSISNVKIYNRALSAQEVLQNYNALKGRYGL